MHQQPLYLDHADAAELDQLADEVSKTKQQLLREAVSDLFVKYRALGHLQPKALKADEPIDHERLRRDVAREIRAIASIDVDALINSGELIPKGRNTFALRDPSVLPKVSKLVKSIANRTVRGKNQVLVTLSSSKKYKDLAARLRDDV